MKKSSVHIKAVFGLVSVSPCGSTLAGMCTGVNVQASSHWITALKSWMLFLFYAWTERPGLAAVTKKVSIDCLSIHFQV